MLLKFWGSIQRRTGRAESVSSLYSLGQRIGRGGEVNWSRSRGNPTSLSRGQFAEAEDHTSPARSPSSLAMAGSCSGSGGNGISGGLQTREVRQRRGC